MLNKEKERRQEQRDFAMKQHYRAKEAASYLGCGLSTVWAYAKQGKLHSIKLSDRVTVFAKDDLDAFVAQGV